LQTFKTNSNGSPTNFEERNTKGVFIFNTFLIVFSFSSLFFKVFKKFFSFVPQPTTLDFF
jgi:hypothetical protein